MASPMFRLDEVRESVKRIQSEGERLVGRIREDAKSLTDVSKLRQDVRQRAEQALEDVQARRAQVRKAVEDAATRLRDGIVKVLRVAEVAEIEEFGRRLRAIETRIEEIARDAKKAGGSEEKAA